MSTIFDSDKPRFTVFTANGCSGDGFVWDEKKKEFVSQWVELDPRTGRNLGRRHIPLWQVTEYMTEKKEGDDVDEAAENQKS